MKYSKKIAKKIVDLYSTGQYTIGSVCDAVGVHRDTFYVWKKNKPEFQEQLNSIEHKRLDYIKDLATSGLVTLLQGKEWEEVTTEYIEGKDGKPKIKNQKKVKKFIMPNPTSIIFTLKNVDPDTFADIVKNELTGKDGKPIQTETRVTHNVVFKKAGGSKDA